MKKVGYLSQKKSNGKVYIYLRKSYREENKVKHEYIYSFGAMPNALEKMYTLRENPEDFPQDLRGRNYNLDDLDDWIMTIETRKTSRGRDFCLKV